MADWKPTWRKPAGVLAMLMGLVVYAVLAVTLVEPISRWPALLQVPIYLALGIVWILPLRRFLIWMETGRWR